MRVNTDGAMPGRGIAAPCLPHAQRAASDMTDVVRLGVCAMEMAEASSTLCRAKSRQFVMGRMMWEASCFHHSAQLKVAVLETILSTLRWHSAVPEVLMKD